MNYFEDDDYAYSDEELLSLSLTYLIDVEDLIQLATQDLTY